MQLGRCVRGDGRVQGPDQGLVEAGSISDRCLHQGPGKSPIKVWIEVGLGVWVVVGVGVGVGVGIGSGFRDRVGSVGELVRSGSRMGPW